MLVLTRKSNQSIMIGDDIEVSVLSIMGEKVRIGIQAPRDIPVTLSSSSVFPLGTQDVFAMAEDLGYDGVEVMVTHNSWSQDGLPTATRDGRSYLRRIPQIEGVGVPRSSLR